jgi:hypothetical protein
MLFVCEPLVFEILKAWFPAPCDNPCPDEVLENELARIGAPGPFGIPPLGLPPAIPPEAEPLYEPEISCLPVGYKLSIVPDSPLVCVGTGLL